MNFFSIFVVLVVVVLHNRCVDAQIHDEAYYEERYKERVEWIRHKLKTYYYSNTPYSKWIRKPKKMAKHPSEQAILVAAILSEDKDQHKNLPPHMLANFAQNLQNSTEDRSYDGSPA